MIQAGTVDQVRRVSGDWVFVDVGFATSGRTCGVLAGDATPDCLTFVELREAIVRAGRERGRPLNLLMEAPLSVAFNDQGNPTGRSVERLGRQKRYWYTGPGCAVLLAATYLLRGLAESRPRRAVRLFEGFVSFRPRSARSSHSHDVVALRDIVWNPVRHPEAVIGPERLAANPTDTVCSAFTVAGMDLGAALLKRCNLLLQSVSLV